MITDGLLRLRSWFADDHVLLNLLLLCIGLFVGGTFATAAECLALIGLSVFFVWMSLRISREGNATSETSVKSNWLAGLRLLLLLSVILAGLVTVFAWRFASIIDETTNVLSVAVDTLAHASLVLLCVFWIFWPQRGHVMMLILGLVSVLMSVAGGGVSTTTTAQTVVGLATCCGFVLASQVILTNDWRDRRDRRQRVGINRRPGILASPRLSFAGAGWPYSVLALSLILIVASGGTQVTGILLPDMQAKMFAQLKDRLEVAGGLNLVGSDRYVDGGKLGSVRKHMLADPMAMALRGYSDSPPGYLRGNVFDQYSRRRWRTKRRWMIESPAGSGQMEATESRELPRLSPAVTPLQESANPARSRFPLTGQAFSNSSRANPKPSAFAGAVEIHGKPEKGTQVFLPANGRWIELAGEHPGITSHGLVDRGVDHTQPWVVGVQKDSHAETLSVDDKQLMLSVSSSIRPAIESLASDVCRGASTPIAKANRIASYFQQRFEYTLNTESAPRGVDPILHFLRTQHPAHCELFASATTLMLRTQGVPTRYVTGYVMDTRNDSDEYYIAKNADAHAWVECHDEDSGMWFPVESTPGRVYRTFNPMVEETSSFSLAETLLGDSSNQNSWLGRLWGWWSSYRTTDKLILVFRIMQLPLLITIVVLLWIRSRRSKGDPEEIARIRARRQMDRRVRRWGWRRDEAETLHQFAGRIETVDSEHRRANDLREAARWYREHAVEIYRVKEQEVAAGTG